MEGMHITLNEKIDKELDKSFAEALTDPTFAKLIKSVKIDSEVGKKHTSKLMDTCEELNNCKGCKGLFMCKNKMEGYVNYPTVEDEKINFIYMPCKYQKELEKKEKEKMSSLNDVANARMKDIDVSDGNRIKVIKWLKEFYDKYEKVNTLKGLYLHGSFGSGKTYLIAALLNELTHKKNAYVEIVYFPELLRNIKEDFSLMEDKMNYLQNVDILLIDDIGAENVTAWGRDEILGTILQSRMNNKLTTFFTSNLNIKELETHLSITKGTEDLVKARRIIERIKQLTEDMELVSVNRRD